MSYRPMFLVHGEWAGNALRFATPEEAAASAVELMSRWFLPEDYRVDTAEESANYRFDAERGNVRMEMAHA